MAVRASTLVLAAAASLASLGLAACHREADTGATANSNAPGRPGTGNGVEVAQPQAGDNSSGRGSSGAKGSMPHPGSSGGDAPAGTTGSGGTGAMGGPGSGLAGGVNAAPGQSTGVAPGSSNSTLKGSVGNR
jgi:hypothetical protein